ncbi:cell division protein FtsL [Lactobacillus sp. UMNPBX9]|nr:cell division protein FtsL [Lactobacillus sp. UMNPBX9]
MEQTARKLNQQPRIVHNNEPEKKYIVQSSPYRSKMMKLFAGSMAWIGVMTTMVISANVKLTNAQLNLQDTTSKITKIQGSNTNMKQEISELSSKSRLSKIAKDSGLKMNTKNTRNVTK